MCSGCGHPAAPGHWAEAGAATPGDRLRARFHRAAILDRVLRRHGLRVHDGGLVPGLQLATLSGREVILPDLSALWQEVELLLGRPFDPLDPEFLDAG